MQDYFRYLWVSSVVLRGSFWSNGAALETLMCIDFCFLLYFLQLNLHEGVEVNFTNNSVDESGAGIYVDFPPIRFVIEFFNRLCFIQYVDGSGTDVEPSLWVSLRAVRDGLGRQFDTQHATVFLIVPDYTNLYDSVPVSYSSHVVHQIHAV